MLFRQLSNVSLRLRAVAVSSNGVFGRRLLSDKKFPSILSDSTENSPFADPSRNRMSTSTVKDTILKSVLVNIKPSESKADKEIHTSIVEESSTTTLPPVIERVQTQPKDEIKLSAIEELTALKESVSKMQASNDGESKSSGEQGGGKQAEDDEAEKERRRERMARNTKIGSAVVFGGGLGGIIAFCLYYGRANRDEEGNAILDQFSDKGFLAPFFRIVNSVVEWRDYVVEPAREKLLPDPLQAPYLQPKYTLVLEMKNVLVAPEWTYKTGYRFIKRPALEYFLDVVGYPNFEVVIYTSESNFAGPAVVESIDPQQRIMFKLFRDCTKYMDGHHVKDLSKLNRDLSKVIFIDFDPNSFKLNPENVLRVPKWEGDMSDTSLVDLAELLKTIHLSDVDDVRPTLQYYSNYDNPATEFRKRALYLQQQEEARKHGFESQDQSLLKRYSGRLFGFKRHTAA